MNFSQQQEKHGAAESFSEPRIIPRSEHNVSRSQISKNALHVLYRLTEANFDAYLVGGGVRDLIVGLQPKDFDVATNAKPEEVKKLFRNCRLIGRRFRLAHVFFGTEIIEVATFRGEGGEFSQRMLSESGMILRDNVYGTLEEDAWRRDFTVNALYYNVRDFSLVDYTNGMEDIEKGVIRMVGDPMERYHEDPVRMLRAIRIAAKLDFKIDQVTEEPIPRLIGLLQNVSSARLFDEIIKWFRGGKSLATFTMLRNYGLFAVLFPQTETGLVGSQAFFAKALLECGFSNTDKRINSKQTLNPAFLFAVLLWWPFQQRLRLYQEDGLKLADAFHLALNDVLTRQCESIAIPNRLVLMIEEIWVLQYRLIQRRKYRIMHIFKHPRFRAAYDFLLLRSEAGEDLQEPILWWEKFQTVDDDERKKMIKGL